MLFPSTNRLEIIKETEYDKLMPDIEYKLNQYGESGYFESFDGGKMYYEYFKASENRASVVIVHGYTEFLKKYYELTWYFLNMGYNVFLYDLRGHGFSHRTVENCQVTHIDCFDEYVKDLECYINKIVMPMTKECPLYLYSHSMGGAIASLYLAKCKNTVKKTILSAPMIYPVCSPLPHQILRRLLKGEAKKYGWDAKFRFSSDFNPNVKLENSMDLSQCRFQYNLTKRINEPRYQNASGTNRWNYEILGIVDTVLKRKFAKSIKSKMLIISGGNDTVVKQRPQRKFAKMLGCDFVCFKNAKHALHTMPDTELKKYIDTLMDFYA